MEVDYMIEDLVECIMNGIMFLGNISMKIFRCFLMMRFDIYMVLSASISGYFMIQLATTSNYSYLYAMFLFLSLAIYFIFKSLQFRKEEKKRKKKEEMDECILTYRSLREPATITIEQTFEQVPTPEEELLVEKERTEHLREMLAAEKEMTKCLRKKVNELEKPLDIDSNNHTEKSVHQRRLEAI